MSKYITNIKITHGNGFVSEIQAIEYGVASNVQKEEDRESFYFNILKQGGGDIWKISEFASKEDAQSLRDQIEDEYRRIMTMTS